MRCSSSLEKPITGSPVTGIARALKTKELLVQHIVDRLVETGQLLKDHAAMSYGLSGRGARSLPKSYR